ncbi:MAG: threonine synthase [Alphaproteobacteria bacterium]|nr:threonine synthase [Alphaproteobacteria bacterium]
MKYISTRGSAPVLDFEGAMLAGLAEDGGLYVPESWPTFEPHEIAAFTGLSYQELAFRVMKPFVGESFSEKELKECIEKAYSTFLHAAIAPLVQTRRNEFILELFHGPTLAFKDFALQLLGHLMEKALARHKKRVVVLGATSGDTGSAAIAGFRGRANMQIVILHPEGRVSEVQRRQMTTVADANVHNLAVEGSFDDCQDIVKTLFADAEVRPHLAAVNSINWARILAQVVYYFYAACALGAPARAVRFVVPTGNFGDIYAGYVAKRCGLPIEKLVIASNRNDILTRCLETGSYQAAGVEPSLSPSMDIQISSNFERLLFDLHDRDGAKLAEKMRVFKEKGTLALDTGQMAKLKGEFGAARIDDAETLKAIAEVHAEGGYVLDPHSAVGVGAGRKIARDAACVSVVLATAHPAKFPDAVEKAVGLRPGLPAHVAGIMTAKERVEKAEADAEAVKKKVQELL